MPANLVTIEDLLQLKSDLINEIKVLLSGTNQTSQSELLKSGEVKAILNCSDSKLDTLRRSGKLPFTRVIGTLYYKRSDVLSLAQ